MAVRFETYERIVDTAIRLFKRYGMKMTVADIARELRMSPANVYKFFPSKKAVIEAIGERRLAEVRPRLLAVTKSRKSAWERMEDLIRAHVKQTEEAEEAFQMLQSRSEALRFKLLLGENRPQFQMDYLDFLRSEFAKLIRAGVEAGEMHVSDPEEAAAALLDCLYRLEPDSLLEDPPAVRKPRLERQLRLLARALA
jgi:AcrR family transcriptional regulator